MAFGKVKEILEKNGFKVSEFATAGEAADYLDGAIDGTTVGFGGSMTLTEMGLKERLEKHNEVFWHWHPKEGCTEAETRAAAAAAEVYLTSVNGLAETGEIINIDGTGNRVASTLFGHKKVYFVVGVNKLAPDYESALHRARNIACVKNAQRMKRKTPCVAGGRCFDCSSPDRICRGLVVLWEKLLGPVEMEVVLVGEPLGY